jgi:DNA modification methylase
MRELLSDTGSIYVHLDYRLVNEIKIVMDGIFGHDQFRNFITWRRQIPRGMKVYAKYMPFSADYILFYTKNDKGVWNIINKENLITIEEAEKKYKKDSKGFFRTSDPGTYSDESLINLHREGKIYVSSGGQIVIKNGRVSVTKGTIGVKYYREKRGNFVVEKTVADNIWDDIPGMGVVSSEYIGYPTQKPVGLLERVIKASSNEGDLVADFFCGSGTTGAVAEKLGRRWIMADLGRYAIHTTRKRLLGIDNCKPFVVQNLGKYERQYWQGVTFKKRSDEQMPIYEYIQFILKLYNAEPLTGMLHIHGKKGRHFVHVGTVDAPVTLTEIKETMDEVKQAGQKALDILGWEWEMGLHDGKKPQKRAVFIFACFPFPET